MNVFRIQQFRRWLGTLRGHRDEITARDAYDGLDRDLIEGAQSTLILARVISNDARTIRRMLSQTDFEIISRAREELRVAHSAISDPEVRAKSPGADLLVSAYGALDSILTPLETASPRRDVVRDEHQARRIAISSVSGDYLSRVGNLYDRAIIILDGVLVYQATYDDGYREIISELVPPYTSGNLATKNGSTIPLTLSGDQGSESVFTGSIHSEAPHEGTEIVDDSDPRVVEE